MTTDRDPIHTQTQPIVSYSVAVTAILLNLIGTKYTKTFKDFEYANSSKGRADQMFHRRNHSFTSLFTSFKRKTWKKILSGKKSITLKQLAVMLDIMSISDVIFFELVDTAKYYLMAKNIPVIPKTLKGATTLEDFQHEDAFLSWALDYNFGDDDESDESDDTLIILTPLTVQTIFAVLEEGMLASQFLEDLETSQESDDEDDDEDENGFWGDDEDESAEDDSAEDDSEDEDCADENCACAECDCESSESADDEDDAFDFDVDGTNADQDHDADESSEELTLQGRITNLEQLRAWIDSMNKNASVGFVATSEEPKSDQDVNEVLSDLLSVFVPQRTEQEEQELDKQELRDALGFRPSEIQKLAQTIRNEKKSSLEKLAMNILEDDEAETTNTPPQATSIYEYERESTAFDFLKSSGWFKTFADTYLEQLGASAEDLDAHKKSQEQQKFMEEYSARLLDTFFKKPKI